MASPVDLDAFELKAPLAQFAYRDSGPVADKANYTTIVVIHGFGYHSASFAPSLNAARKLNARLVVLNRREYPGSVPYSDDQRAELQAALQASPEEARKVIVPFMKDRAKEIAGFISAFIEKESIPPVDASGAGGVVLTSWSMAAFWLMAFLRYAASFEGTTGVKLENYMHRAIIHDAPSLTLGFTPPPDPWGPLLDDTIPPPERVPAFNRWIGSYFDHASSPDGLERRTAQASPPPTTAACDPSLLPHVFSGEIAAPGGSDFAHLVLPLMAQLNAEERQDVLFGDVAAAEQVGPAARHWMALPVRYVYCNRSIWEMPWCVKHLEQQVAEQKEKGRTTRKVSVKTLEGANHFVHWDDPETFVQALVAQD